MYLVILLSTLSTHAGRLHARQWDAEVDKALTVLPSWNWVGKTDSKQIITEKYVAPHAFRKLLTREG